MLTVGRTLAVAAVFIIGVGLTLKLQDDRTEPVEPHPLIDPFFTITRTGDELILDGHTVSALHEQGLLDVAASAYLESRVRSNFEPLGIVPDHWQDTTIQTTYALATLESATAELRPGTVSIRGVALNDFAWNARLDALRKAIPPDVALSADTIQVAPVNPAAVCARAFDSFFVGPINFEESTDNFRASAYPVLDRVAALVDACRDTSLRITGHTDSSGNEASNRALSLKRAEAVVRYLEGRGIAAVRMQAVGAGSTEPVATNETRYGRSLNRRIEFEFDVSR